MVLIKSFCIALSTYTAIPLPQFLWEGEAMAYLLCFLPFAGLLIGGAMELWLFFCARFGAGLLFSAAGAAVLPLLITGGIHMDGFCDTMDALSSHQPPERCLEIMKDSRAGAFAVISCGVYLILCLGLYSELIGTEEQRGLVAIFVLSRALTVPSVIFMKNARGTGMLAAFTKPAHRLAPVAAAVGWLLLGALAAARAGLAAAAGILLFLILAAMRYYRLTTRRFGGITGDTSGFFIQMGELAMLFGLVLSKLLAR